MNKYRARADLLIYLGGNCYIPVATSYSFESVIPHEAELQFFCSYDSHRSMLSAFTQRNLKTDALMKWHWTFLFFSLSSFLLF